MKDGPVWCRERAARFPIVVRDPRRLDFQRLFTVVDWNLFSMRTAIRLIQPSVANVFMISIIVIYT